MATANETGSTHGTDQGVMDRVREGAAARLSSQKDRATDSLGSLARAVRDSSRPLRENQQETLAQYLEKAADGIERFSAKLRERDVKELMHEAQQFARRQPALFLGAAFAAGVIAARFLKSSSTDRDRGASRMYGYSDPALRQLAQPVRRYGQPETPYTTGGR
jgi:hypothetical protein